MKIVECWKEEGVTIPAPYARNIKGLLGPDKEGVQELLFTQALIYPKSQTDYHSHDRPELIYVVSGRGVAVSAAGRREICADTVLWVEKDEMHQMVNTGEETLKLATVFIPPYTVGENYDRCLKAAEAARRSGGGD